MDKYRIRDVVSLINMINNYLENAKQEDRICVMFSINNSMLVCISEDFLNKFTGNEVSVLGGRLWPMWGFKGFNISSRKGNLFFSVGKYGMYECSGWRFWSCKEKDKSRVLMELNAAVLFEFNECELVIDKI